MRTDRSTSLAEEIKERCNIVDVVGRVVPLKKTGANHKGPCPFHKEADPSFVVSEDKQIFTCFGCGATGDVISFVEKYYSLDFIGAAEKLADEYGIDMNKFRQAGGENKDPLYEVNRDVARFFYRALRERANPGYSYMQKRGITNDILNRFGIGYADDRWDSLYQHMKRLGHDEKTLLRLGLISESKGRYFDKFRSRVIFPILNTRNRVIGFGGRIIGDGEPKYLNSQETPVFSKKNNLYGLHITRQDIAKADRAVLVEGYMDAVSLYQHGVRNVAASLGTALTENQANLLKRYTKNVVLSYDADEAGQKAAFRGSDILYSAGCRPRVLKISSGKDPDDFIKEKGRQEFMKLVDDAVPFVDFKLGIIKSRYDMNDTQARIDFLKEAVAVLEGLSPIEADIYISKLSQEAGISETAIRKELGALQNAAQRRAPAPRREDGGEGKMPDLNGPEKNLVKLMLTDKRYFEEIMLKKVLEGPAAEAIAKACGQRYEKEEQLDTGKLMESLDENVRAALEDIIQNVYIRGKEEEVLRESIRTMEAEKFEKKEKQLLQRLSIAEEEGSQKDIEDTMKEIADLQREINNRRGAH